MSFNNDYIQLISFKIMRIIAFLAELGLNYFMSGCHKPLSHSLLHQISYVLYK